MKISVSLWQRGRRLKSQTKDKRQPGSGSNKLGQGGQAPMSFVENWWGCGEYEEDSLFFDYYYRAVVWSLMKTTQAPNFRWLWWDRQRSLCCCCAIIYDVIHDTFHAECWREYEQQQIHRCTSSRVCTWCKSRRESHSQSSKSTMMSSRRRRCTSCIASLGVCARAITRKFIWIIQDLYTLQPVDFTSEWRPVHIDRASV